MNRKYISFEYDQDLQGRFLQFKSAVTGLDDLYLAVKYGKALRDKINSKYCTVCPRYIREHPQVQVRTVNITGYVKPIDRIK